MTSTSFSSDAFITTRLAVSPAMMLNNLSYCDGRVTYARKNAVRTIVIPEERLEIQTQIQIFVTPPPLPPFSYKTTITISTAKQAVSVTTQTVAAGGDSSLLDHKGRPQARCVQVPCKSGWILYEAREFRIFDETALVMATSGGIQVFDLEQRCHFTWAFPGTEVCESKVSGKVDSVLHYSLLPTINKLLPTTY